VSNLCVAQGTICDTTGASCQDGRCQACGHLGEACCPPGSSTARCQSGTLCSTTGSGDVCARCGALGDACCAGATCGQGCCSAGQCVAISGCPSIPTICGNGALEAGEICDDGNTSGGDGCAADCLSIDPGWQCRVPGKRCIPLCGDGVLNGSEACDDGNALSGDGCSSTCQLEPGSDCSTPGKPCIRSICGDGKLDPNELCDCGTDPTHLPSGCAASNGVFYGDGKGCSLTCTKEPVCKDASGKTQACTVACGDNRIDPGEDCDDGNLVNGDGCSSTCTVERGFTCAAYTVNNSTACESGSGTCLQLPVIYRDFQPQNVSPGGHPDFYYLSAPDMFCVPNTAGPARGNDSTARCWGIAGNTLLDGKPQAGSGTTCKCQFSDWNVGNTDHIPGGYSRADSPLAEGSGYRTDVVSYTPNGGPIWTGTVPAYRDASSFKQWFSDDATVNQSFRSMLELTSIGSNIYQYASRVHLADGGFFPLDVLNRSQATLCNLWPYWNSKFFPSCRGDQYLFPPRVLQTDCPNANPLSNGCWVGNVSGTKHDCYFTEEIRYQFSYDGATGFSLSFYGDDDLFVFINGQLVLDLGGVHQQLPGKVTVSGNPGDAQVTEGGCLDTAGNITGVTAGSKACSPTNVTAPTASTPDDFRVRKVALGLHTGSVYEVAIFGADRHPPESNFQLTLSGATNRRSSCVPKCGDGIVSGAEECDCGDGSVATPSGCSGPNDDASYGACNRLCRYGSYCGDGIKNGPEECDLGTQNGDASLGAGGCSVGCKKPHFCGDGILDSSLGEQCDLGANNGLPGYACTSSCALPGVLTGAPGPDAGSSIDG
jgi:cysteine-rich repeat protein